MAFVNVSAVQIPQMLQSLLLRFNDESKEVVEEAWKALEKVTSKISKVVWISQPEICRSTCILYITFLL